MPSNGLERLKQQRARRAEQAKLPSGSSTKKQEATTANLHKSRMACRILDAIMCDSGRDRYQVDKAIQEALRKYSSLVHHVYRKCMPTFNGMPSLFTEMQKRHPQRPMRDKRLKGDTTACHITHVQTCHSGHELHFCRINGYSTCFRKQWPNYRRSLFTVACAFDRSAVVRMLVEEFKCDLDKDGMNEEDGLVLVDKNGNERKWQMTGFDLAIEFGCVRTFDLLCALSKTYPSLTATFEYADTPIADLREMCKLNHENRLTSYFDAEKIATALGMMTDDSCKCAFCAGNK